MQYGKFNNFCSSILLQRIFNGIWLHPWRDFHSKKLCGWLLASVAVKKGWLSVCNIRESLSALLREAGSERISIGRI